MSNSLGKAFFGSIWSFWLPDKLFSNGKADDFPKETSGSEGDSNQESEPEYESEFDSELESEEGSPPVSFLLPVWITAEGSGGT